MPVSPTNAPLTEAEWIEQVGGGLGEPDKGDAAIVAAYDELKTKIPLFWRMYADKQRQGGRVRYLYARREAVNLLIGHMWQAVTNSDSDVSESLSDLSEHLAGIREDLDAQILAFTTSRSASRGPVVGQMLATQPIEPTPGCPDPSDRMYRGDPMRAPYYRYRR